MVKLNSRINNLNRQPKISRLNLKVTSQHLSTLASDICCNTIEILTRTLHQNHIILFLAIQRLHLQGNRLADKVRQLRQALRFFIQEHINHRL